MKIKHDDIEIDEQNPFGNCKLERKKYAGILTDIVRTYSDGFVLAINNEWGAGKTTFVKMWQQHLKILGYETLYFNAWENDFNNNPLVALMAELNTLTKNETKLLFKSLVEKGAVLTKKVLPALLKAIAAKYIDTQMIQDAIENTTKAATEILDDEIKEYTSKKEGLEDFKDELAEFVNKTKGNKPIVFIIDELDRCRPDYSVELLEQIKHFFSVKGIVFVLSIDKIQLSNAVRGFYGSDRINADEYLRRFIDLEYSMPEPDPKVFCEYLYDYFEFHIFFEHHQRIKFQELREDKKLLVTVASMMFRHTNLPLRKQEKIFAHTRIILNCFTSQNYIYPGLLMFLIILRFTNFNLYSKIRLKQLTLVELLNEFSKVVPPQPEDRFVTKYFTQIEANLFWMYNNSESLYKVDNLITRDEKGNETLVIKSRYSKEDTFIHYLLNVIKMGGRTEIEYLIDKIELTQLFNI